MNRLALIKPSRLHEDQVMSYRDEMLQNKDTLDGCAGLEEVQSYEEWINFDERLRAKGYVPSQVYLAIRQSDDYLVGIIDFRHPLNQFLLEFGGNIGYSIRPSERQKGYASEMLGLILPISREACLDRVLLTCDKDNIASRKTLLKNGGILENEVKDTVGLSNCGIIQRFWISL